MQALLQQYGSPLLILQKQQIAKQYAALQRALPMVKHHFAIKALRHPAAIAAVNECGGYFDVMTNSDIEMVRDHGIEPLRCMHTNPIKKTRDIMYGINFGLQRFVVDNETEIDKIAPYGSKVELIIRLSFPNPLAKSDLSVKFGVRPEEAHVLIAHALKRGLRVIGFTLHVGSQINTVSAYSRAITTTIELANKIEATYGITLRVFDIGGGFPVSYLQPAPSITDIATEITPLLIPLTDRFELLSEPGRFVVAPAMTLMCRIVGKSQRYGKPWYYVDDGVYGSFSNLIYEDIRTPIIAYSELTHPSNAHLVNSTIAGPSCDSVDIIATDCMLPDLNVGDMLVSPMMGAYTSVSASDFNGIKRTPIIVFA